MFFYKCFNLLHHRRWSCSPSPSGRQWMENKLQRSAFKGLRMWIYFRGEGVGQEFLVEFTGKEKSRRWFWLRMDAGRWWWIFVSKKKSPARWREEMWRDLRHRDGRFRVQLLAVKLKFFGHTPPIMGVEVVVGASLDGTTLVVVRVSWYSHDPHFLLDVISPVTLITKRNQRISLITELRFCKRSNLQFIRRC